MLLVIIPANATIQTTSVEVRGTVANETSIAGGFNLSNANMGSMDSPVWTPLSFSGFYYDNDYGFGAENLEILSINERTIPKDNLIYTTYGQSTTLGVVDYVFEGNAQDAISNGLEKFESGQMGPDDGTYTIVGWLGGDYVGIKNKPNKLAKLILEQDSSEKETLATGETWEIGEGWNLTAQSIDSRTTPRQALFVLSKDGIEKDSKIIPQGKVYTYIEKNIGGESDVPLFVTYIDSVFAGSTSDIVQLKYTWVIDTSITEIKSGDTYGIFKVDGTDPIIEFKNDAPITLNKAATIDLMGEFKFQVADNDELRIYPLVEYEMSAGETNKIAEEELSLLENETENLTETITPTVAATVQRTSMATEAAKTEPVQSAIPTPVHNLPGFEIMLAMSSIVAVIYLLRRQIK
jgi:S-layer protein (TIGR01567 family)